jgi:hypothetical protein
MGFQTTHNTKRVTQPNLKGKDDLINAQEHSFIPRTLNFIPSTYDSWLVSKNHVIIVFAKTW